MAGVSRQERHVMTDRQLKLLDKIYTCANRIVSRTVDIKLNYPRNTWNINYKKHIEDAERNLVELNMAMGELLPLMDSLDEKS